MTEGTTHRPSSDGADADVRNGADAPAADPARTGGAAAAARWWGRPPARIAYVAAGTGFGLAVASASHRHDAPQWLAWASLAVALSTASGAVFGYGLARWPEAAGPGTVRLRRVAPALARLAAVGAAMLAVGAAVTVANGGNPVSRQGGDLIGLVLTVFAVTGAMPVAAGLAAVRAGTGGLPDSVGERAEAVIALRRLLSDFLNAMGALVALATLALGAAVRLRDVRFDGTVVVVFGANMSLLVALAYAPAAGAVRDCARRLAATALPLAGTAAAELAERVDGRKRLEQALGVDRGVFADLQSDLVILAPLLASGAAVFLPR